MRRRRSFDTKPAADWDDGLLQFIHVPTNTLQQHNKDLTHVPSHHTRFNSIHQLQPSWSCPGSGPGSRPADPAHGKWWVLLGWLGGRQLPAGGAGLAGELGRVCGGSRSCRQAGADTAVKCEQDRIDADLCRTAAASRPPDRRLGHDGPPPPEVCSPAFWAGTRPGTSPGTREQHYDAVRSGSYCGVYGPELFCLCTIMFAKESAPSVSPPEPGRCHRFHINNKLSEWFSFFLPLI